MDTPLVSVIIPNYNHAKYLDERIQSVLDQTYQNYEIIILDDHSTDNSVEVINKYKDNPHVSHIVVNEENSGSTFKQWHKGMELAKGEWIWIAESDDYCESDLLESLMKQVINNKNVSITYCTSQKVNSEGGKIIPIEPLSNLVDFYEGKSFIKKRMSHTNAIINASSAVFRKDCALALNKQYMDYVAAGDRLFWIELSEAGDVVHLRSPQNYFRQHMNKVSPWKEKAGVTSSEDFKIVRYLEKKHLINCFEGILARSVYLHRVKKISFDDNNIKHNLENMWSYNGKVPVWILLLYGKVILNFQFYIIHLPIYELRKWGIIRK